MSDEAIKNVLQKSGVNDAKNQDNKYTFLWNESNASSFKGTGKMDYVTQDLDLRPKTSSGGDSTIPISNFSTLFVTSTKSGLVAHNNNNFGNFLWGAGASALGSPEFIARFGAHYHNYFIDPKNKGTLDSKDDQFSIHLGFEWQKAQKK